MKKVFLGLAAGFMLFVFSMSPVSAQFWGSSSAPKGDEAPVHAEKKGNENWNQHWNDDHKDGDKDSAQDEGCAVPQGNANSKANSNHNMRY